MKYFLGIDGGGTKTTYQLIDENNQIIEEITGLGTSIDTYSLEIVKERLLTHIEKFNYPLSGIYAGLGGITSFEDIIMIENILKSAKNLIGKVGANNDVTNALCGALNGDGIVLIAGTGAVAYGKNKQYSQRSGGYGYKEGDAGSSYSLGYQALQYLARVIDKRLPMSDFAKALQEETKCFNFANLAKFLDKAERSFVASLSKIVTKFASLDKHAYKIVEDNVNEAILMIETVYRECRFEKANFSIIGGLGNADSLYKELLLKKLNKNITYIPKIYEASFGASLLAKSL